MTPFDGISPERLDASAIWWGLSPPLRAAVGALAIQIAAARIVGSGRGLNPTDAAVRACDQAEIEAIGSLETWLFPEIIPQLRGGDRRIRVPAIIGAVCRECGASEFDGNPEWAEDDLCTVCDDERRDA